MTIGEKWIIYWSEFASDTYLYGSEVIIHRKDDVEFSNLLMPPGTVIKQWYSRTNFQLQKIEPTLPMIDGESRYQVIVNIDCPENENWLVRLVFYDRYGEEAGDVFVRSQSAVFRCPLRTYSYRLQLINGGLSSLHFHSIVIREVIDETGEQDQKNE